MPDNRFLPKDIAAELLHSIESSPIRTVYESEKHRLTLLDEAGSETMHFRLPITLPYPVIEPEKSVNYVVLLIQAGNCALGYFENGRCLDHKVYRSYMVRKKQGKSQIKYLKTKGKSRAGSRVRLGETEEFFTNINTRLQNYFQQHRIDRIAISCSKTLLPYLYTGSVPTPFDKRDPRLFKIPKHIHTPIYEVLLDANRFLLRGELISLTETGFAAVPLVEEFLLHALDAEGTQLVDTVQEETADEVYINDDWDDNLLYISFPDDEDGDDIVDWDDVYVDLDGEDESDASGEEEDEQDDYW